MICKLCGKEVQPMNNVCSECSTSGREYYQKDVYKFYEGNWHTINCPIFSGGTDCICDFEKNKKDVEIVFNNKALGMISEKELEELEKEASQPTVQDKLAKLEKEVEILEEKLYQIKIKIVTFK